MSRSLLVLVLLLGARIARAHGGEDHGAPAAAAATQGADGKRTSWAQSDAFEVLLKYAPPAEDGDASLLVFIADTVTNVPVAGAKVEIELTGPDQHKLVAEPAGSPGVYHATGRLAFDSYDAVVTIEAGSAVDVVQIKAVDLSIAAQAAAAPAARHSPLPWLAIALGGGTFVLLVGIAVAVGRRGRTRIATAATIAMLVAVPLVARAHGGEDHGEQEAKPAAATPSLPPGGVYMAKESQFLLGVRTARAVERDVEARVEAVGRVVPRADGQATITAPQPGRVVAAAGGKLPYLGDRVKRGQPLFALEQTLGAADASTLQAQALQARAAISQARARRDQAQRELVRRRSLEGVVAKKEIEQAQLELDLTNREVQLAEQQASLFGGGGLRRVTVTAPIDGTIAEASVSLGDQVTTDKVLYTIIDGATLWVDASVFEADVARIEQAGTADIRVEGYEQPFVGTVYRIGQIVDATTRTVKVILAVDNPQGRLRVGTFARVAVGAGGKHRALTIADAAVIEEGGRRFAFVHVSPEVFVRREIVLGARDGDAWAVQAGLVAGDRVVTQGTYQLRTSR